MIVIDHRYYPHIIDLIWSEMEFDELWAVRSVSKAWLIRADLELSTHVVIERMDATAFNAKVICLAHPGHTINITQAAMGCLMPDAKYPHPDDICALCERIDWTYAVVDVVGYSPNSLQEEVSCLWFTHPGQFRWRCDLFRDFDASEPERLPDSNESYVFYFDLDATAQPKVTLDTRDGDRTLVFNVDCYADPTATTTQRLIKLHIWRASSCSGMLRFIFQDKQTAGQPDLPRNTSLILGFLDYYPSIVMSVQLIGLERFITDPEKLKAFKRAIATDFVNRRAERDGNARSRDHYKKQCRSEMRRVEYLTMEEYEKKVGRHQFFIDTVK